MSRAMAMDSLESIWESISTGVGLPATLSSMPPSARGAGQESPSHAAGSRASSVASAPSAASGDGDSKSGHRPKTRQPPRLCAQAHQGKVALCVRALPVKDTYAYTQGLTAGLDNSAPRSTTSIQTT